MASPAPSGTNTFVPSMEASGNLFIGFSRNINKFAINRYGQIVPTKKSVGLYASWNSRQAARIDDNRFNWPDGAAAPDGADNLESWLYLPFTTSRDAPTFTIGNKAVDQADWPVLAASGGVVAQQAMTKRTKKAIRALRNAPWNDHAIAVDGVNAGGYLPSGQNWGNGSADEPNIKLSILHGATLVSLATLDAVSLPVMKLIVNPNVATRMASSPEIHSYLARSPFALDQVLGRAPGQNTQWGLPDQLYGMEVEVESTVQNTAAKGSDALSYVLGDDEAYLVSKIGDLEGIEGMPSYTTVMGFFYEEFTVESKVDTDNRLTWGRVVQDYTYLVSSTYTGIKFTGLFGTAQPPPA